MPKLRKTDAQKRSEFENEMKIQIRSALIIICGSMEEAADELGWSKTTLWRRLNDPQNMTVGQLRELAGILPRRLMEPLREYILPLGGTQ